MQANYSEIVKSTFETKALRTVLVIDDEFPSYANLLDDEGAKARYKELSVRWPFIKDLRLDI